MSHYGVKLHRSDVLRLPEHAGACTKETFEEWCQAQIDAGGRLAVDLFSGAGGLGLGLEQAGWQIAVSVDCDERALETHRANFPGLALNVDLGDERARTELVDLLRSTRIDLVAGGPPCQPFSRAGRSKIRSLVETGARDRTDLRKELWRSYLQVVLQVRPRAVLMENVPDMALGDEFRVVRHIVHQLELAGYHTQVNMVDAWRYGVPQHRKRLMVLARLDTDTFTWPKPVAAPVFLRDAIADLPVLPESDPVGKREMPYRPRHEPSRFSREMREGVLDAETVHDHMTRPVRADDLEVFRLMNHRTLYSEIPARLRRYRADQFDDKYKRLDWNNYSRTITAHIAKDGYWYIHPEQHRTLTVREAARVQTFPDRFRFAGTRSDAFRQIGNAVPPVLGRAAGAALLPMGGDGSAENRWKELHRTLQEWSDDRRRGRFWYQHPGPDVRQAVASVVAVVGPAQVESHGLGEVLGKLRGRVRLSPRDLDRLRAATSNARIEKRLARFEVVASKQKVWKDLDELVLALELKPAERSLFLLLMGLDVMPASQGALRVAARVAGSKVDERNRLTDGRVEIARLIGGGEFAPLRMAGIRHLSMSVCHPKDPHCPACPLQRWCRYAADNRPDGALY